MSHVKLTGIHRPKKKLSSGEVRTYHYVYRGGPQFWNSASGIKVGSQEYLEAYISKSKPGSMNEASQPESRNATSAVIRRYKNSAHFKILAPRTKDDYEKYLDSLEEEFGPDPIMMFEEKEALSEIRTWKDQWSHSPRQYDYATSIVTRLLNWAKAEDTSIVTHFHMDIARIYKSKRAHLVWLPEEIQALKDVANERETRIVVAASEGGLTPQDIGLLKREHVQRTPKGRRLFFKRTKTGNPVAIPVTPALAELIDNTPKGQEYLVVSLEGHRLQPERASGIVRDLRNRVNALAKDDPAKYSIRDELHLYDMRGTAATELLRAGCSLEEIAITMGWGLRHASNIIEKYVALVPEKSDEVLRKLAEARKKSGIAG
ncbi:tyrosine-type recombinase/integrase [Roseobacter sp. SK209-2-6]|uniref:tyrosine-type recombinase/integrase n=1 Tax=Roseobacter sp. SK209-2-6 TaxID=388739 RepID=UPI00030FF4FF|nr:tyrosine-type recombinase/integrase [Roseobacter sp. SK209-2-6]